MLTYLRVRELDFNVLRFNTRELAMKTVRIFMLSHIELRHVGVEITQPGKIARVVVEIIEEAEEGMEGAGHVGVPEGAGHERHLDVAC
jgi:hypothetical protein